MSSYGTYTPYYNPPGQELAVPVPFANASDDNVRITGHEVNHTNQTVDMWIQWRMHPDGPLRTVRFAEFDVHEAKPQMVFDYWKSLGGRDVATKLTEKNVQAITDECESWYAIQYTGYDDMVDIVVKCAIKSDYPRLVRNWNEAKRSRGRTEYCPSTPSGELVGFWID
ncbi:uncharacterized protein B0J16DRAFT_388226 [Fusarium flagelliforme]|uniref:Uncharacterized protein n=1 Tax=Fusarium flagelliforme TaxID=2675880 RepID=A0A395MIQ2_9HYPO|nr:uncharacterized protein B0J16DRAFT_388226 [Fusarium flagelliforme]KAH7174406.1 hypothetical protein B0J16DRAFT_388226 [Fusarium flagelliforme]RFN47153.1 hypothetical protein FIE12Z_8609 [Fusarium flagelliforme]